MSEASVDESTTGATNDTIVNDACGWTAGPNQAATGASHRSDPQVRRGMRRFGYRQQVAAAALLSVALRAAFLFVPISPDEGGYLAIARSWRHGATLYKDIWIDRPQGLLAIYRFFDLLGGTSSTVRLLSLLAAVITVVGIAELVRSLGTPAAGAAAALMAAFLTTAPALDGFAANGELLGGSFGALALGIGARVLTRRCSGRWMVAAGALAGAALSVKQSSADSLAALLIWLSLAVLFGLLPRREAVLHLARCAAGAVLVIGVLLLHAALTGWDRWYYAILGYRVSQRSALENVNWDRLTKTAPDVLPVLLPVVVAVVAAMLMLGWPRQRTLHWSSTHLLLFLWVDLALVMFLSGGQFFHHYWLTLTYPIAAIGGLFIGGLRLRWWRRSFLAAALLPAALSWWSFATTPPNELWQRLTGERRVVAAEQLGEWLPSVMQPGDTVFVMCSLPSFYAVAEKDPVYPYMWWDSVLNPTGAQQAMIDLFTGTNPPTWVPRVFNPSQCNPSGEVATVFRDRYHLERVMFGIAIFRLNE